jgi:tetratricopeptide (TPR) repeat protein
MAPALLLLLLQLPGQTPFQNGQRFRSEGNHTQARASFQQAWDAGYEDPYVLYSLVEEDQALGDKAAGLAHFQLLMARFPDSPWLHVLYANAHMLKDREEEARKEYEEAIALDPKLPGVNFRLGYIAFRNGGHAQAETYFRRELQLNPTYSDANLFLGETLRQLGRAEECLPYYRKAIETDPKSGLAYRALVTVLTDKGDLEGAAAMLTKAETQFPSDPSFPAQLARILTRLHRDDEARRQQARFRTLMEQQRRLEKPVEMVQ